MSINFQFIIQQWGKGHWEIDKCSFCATSNDISGIICFILGSSWSSRLLWKFKKPFLEFSRFWSTSVKNTTVYFWTGKGKPYPGSCGSWPPVALISRWRLTSNTNSFGIFKKLLTGIFLLFLFNNLFPTAVWELLSSLPPFPWRKSILDILQHPRRVTSTSSHETV